MARDETKKKDIEASSQAEKLSARNAFADGDYRGAVIDSAHMINLSAEASFLKQQRDQKQQSAQNKKVGPSAE